MKIRLNLRQISLCLMLYLSAKSLSILNAQNPAPPSDAPFANATVADFTDKVQLQLPGQALSAPTRGQILPPETVVNTENGRISLRLEDGGEVLIHPNTRLVLKQPSTASWQRLQLLLGRIKVEVQKRMGGSPPFQIGTPSAVIAVRGTRFYVEVNKQKATEVDVEDGVVELANAKGIGAPILVKAGFSGRVKEDSAPETPQPTEQLKRQLRGAVGQGNPGKHDNGPGMPNPSPGPPANPPVPKSGKKP
jgi:hypothetical protein